MLIHGASGGVGTMAVQLAAGRGAVVIATASPARHEFLRELGATPVAYGDGLADRVRAAARQGVDAALDLVGTDEAVDVSLELVADRGRIATIVASRRAFDLGLKVLGGAPGADPGHRDPQRGPAGPGAAGRRGPAARAREPHLPARRRGRRAPADRGAATWPARSR